MADTTNPDGDAPFLSLQAVRPFPLIALSGCALLLALAGPPEAAMMGVLGAGAGLVAAAVVLWILMLRDVLTGRWRGYSLLAQARKDPAPVALGDMSGRVRFVNDAAISALRLEGRDFTTVDTLFMGALADPGSVTSRLLRCVESVGYAHEDISTSEAMLRLRAHKRGTSDVIWRIEIISNRRATRRARQWL